ncbi:MAG: hypothetical protein ACW97P_03070 [Candidatus Hodarchaeales archaeon]|jgi:hypothetical protein
MKKKLFQLKNLIQSNLYSRKRGSPLVEEGILIGLSLFGFLLIFSIVTGVLDWLLLSADELLTELGSLFN